MAMVTDRERSLEAMVVLIEVSKVRLLDLVQHEAIAAEISSINQLHETHLLSLVEDD